MFHKFVSFFVLSAVLLFSSALFAQQGDNAQDVLEAVKTLGSKIAELESQGESAPSETEREELFTRAEELRQEKRLDFALLSDSKGLLKELDGESKKLVAGLIREDLKSASNRVLELNKLRTKLRKSLEKEKDTKVLLGIEDKIDVQNKKLVESLIIMSKGLTQLTALVGKSDGTLRKTFEKYLEENARGVSSMLSLQLETRKKIRERAVSTDAEKAQRNSDKVRIDDRIDRASTDLKGIIELLKENKKDATEYQQLLIESTGTITSDVFDKDVSIGLLQKWYKRGEAWFLEKLPNMLFKLALFFLILLFAKIVSSLARRLANRWLAKTSLSELAKGFLSNASGRLVFAIGVLFGLSQLGLDVTALIAGFGVAGIVVGFALQDTLSNFASGLMILFYQPFDTGDLIRAADVEGVVNKMTLVSTEILTLDNQRFVIPNNKIWQNVIQNVTAEPHRRVDFVFGVGYEDDLQKAESILHEIVLAEENILAEPEPLVRVHELADSSVNFVVRMWVNTDDYWDAYWNVTRAVKDRFDAEGISIPFPQTDVHLHRPPNE